MESEHRFKPIEYVCPICGESAAFGTHFCKSKGEKARERRRLPVPVREILAAVVAILLVEALLWGMVGAYSLCFLAAVPLAAVIFLAFRRSPIGRSAAERRELRRLAGGDDEAVERLIALERKKRPDEKRRELVREILRQWRKDLR
jgi:hypothetical protein